MTAPTIRAEAAAAERYRVTPGHPLTSDYGVIDGDTGRCVSTHPTWSQAHSAAAALNNPRTRLTKTPAPERPELDALIDRAMAAYAALPPDEQAALLKRQGENWARADLAIDRGPAARRTVSTPARHIDRHLLPAEPCCDCRERMERYRVALAQIYRFSNDREYAASRALDALAGGK